MSPSVLTEGMHDAEFLISEASGNRSRANLLLEADGAADRVLAAGTVLARKRGAVTVSGYAINAADVGTFATTPVAGAGAKEGTYKLTILEPATNAGTFQVEDPDGEVIGTGVVGSAFALGGLSFTLQDGTQDFVSGEGYDIIVAAGTKYVAHNQDGTDGSEIARAILRNGITVPTGVDTVEAAYVRDCEVHGDEITWKSDITAGEKLVGIAQLAEVGILVRTQTV